MSETCIECRSKCCRFIAIPEKYKGVMYTSGVLLSDFETHIDANPGIWLGLHEGITVIDDVFRVSRRVPFKILETRHGPCIVLYSRCASLQDDFRCAIYASRPELCRNFDETTAMLFHVPAGCKYDPDGKYGQDYEFED